MADPAYGLAASDPANGGRLRIPLGLLDKPTEQKQEPFVLDSGRRGGHLCILGAPQTGKSTRATTHAGRRAALTHTPADLAFYCVDFGGGALGSLGRPADTSVEWPVAWTPTAYAARSPRSACSCANASAVRPGRHRLRRRDAPHALRRPAARPRCADIALVIDNYPVLKSDFEDVVDLVQDLGTRGLGYGIHLILSSTGDGRTSVCSCRR